MRASSVPVERRACSEEVLGSRSDSAGRGRRHGQGPGQGPSRAPARICSASAHDAGAVVRKKKTPVSSPSVYSTTPCDHLISTTRSFDPMWESSIAALLHMKPLIRCLQNRALALPLQTVQNWNIGASSARGQRPSHGCKRKTPQEVNKESPFWYVQRRYSPPSPPRKPASGDFFLQ